MKVVGTCKINYFFQFWSNVLVETKRMNKFCNTEHHLIVIEEILNVLIKKLKKKGIGVFEVKLIDF